MPHPTDTTRHTHPTIAERLKSSEPWLPIGEGDCAETAPLMILDTDKHVALEHFIAQLLMEEEGLDFRFSEQSFLPHGERYIDKLTFDVKPEGATEWQGQRAFHFDITAGFNALQARLNSATPTIDTQSHNRKTPITPTT